MDQLLALLAVLAVLGLGGRSGPPDPPVASAAPAADAAPAPRRVKRCGSTIGDDGVRYDIMVGKGPVSCTNAQRVFRTLFAGAGVAHPAPRPGDAYTQVGRWRCFFGMGTWECERQAGARQRVVARPQRRVRRACAAELRPAGVRTLTVEGVACENAARLIDNWSRASKGGLSTRVGGFSCLAEGPGGSEASSVRCRGAEEEVVEATFAQPG